MNFLGIGPLELLVIFVIILVVLGPKDMVKTGRNIGKFIRKVSTSDFWKVLTQAKSELSTLPNKLAREAGFDELEKDFSEINNLSKELNINKIGGSLESWTQIPESKNNTAVDLNPSQKSEEKPEDKIDNTTEA